MARIERMVTVYENHGTLRSIKLNRNTTCSCGSGKKQKYCHPQEKARYFSDKPKAAEPGTVDKKIETADEK